MRNRYAGSCIRCKTHVEAGEGHFEKVNRKLDRYKGVTGRWVVRCLNCVRVSDDDEVSK